MKELVNRLENFLSRGPQSAEEGLFSNPKDLDDWIKQQEQFGHSHVWVTDVDIDNDGRDDHVLKYSREGCPGTGFWGSALIVLDQNETRINVSKTEPLLFGYQGAVYEVFLYKDVTYFVVWDGKESGEVLIVRSRDNKAEQVGRVD